MSNRSRGGASQNYGRGDGGRQRYHGSGGGGQHRGGYNQARGRGGGFVSRGGGDRNQGPSDHDLEMIDCAKKMEICKISEASQQPDKWCGINGKQIKLIVNYFNTNYKNCDVHEYRVDIYRVKKADKIGITKPAQKPGSKEKADDDGGEGDHPGLKAIEVRYICREYFWRVVREYEHDFGGLTNCVYDDMHFLWTKTALNMLPDVNVRDFPFTIPPSQFEPAAEIVLRVKYSRKTSLDVENMKVFNMLLTQNARCTLSQPVLENKIYCDLDRIYMTPQDLSQLNPVVHYDLDEIFIMLKALYVTARMGPPGTGTALVNYDTAHSTFFKINQAAYRLNVSILKFYAFVKSGGRTLSDEQLMRLKDYSMDYNQRQELKRLLSGLKLLTIIGRHNRYSFYDISNESARTKLIDVEGVRMSIEKYYKTKYNINLRFPLMPLIQVAPEARKTLLPIETLVISDQWQRLRRLLPENLQALTNAFTTKHPSIRFGEIVSMMNDFHVTADVFARHWDVRVNTSFMQIDGRVINKPMRSIEPALNGPWKAIEPPHSKIVISLLIVNGALSGEAEAREHLHTLIVECKLRGIIFALDHALEIREASLDGNVNQIGKLVTALKNTFESRYQNEKLKPTQLILFVLPNASSDMLYSGIKTACEIDVGVFSQVLKTKTFIRNYSYKNVFLKINAKLGGTVTKIGSQHELWTKFTAAPTLFVGIDVTHPPPGDSEFPSLASVVANTNPDATKYAAIVREQPSGMEYIANMREMFVACVKNYFRKNKKLPKHIMVFRDGVSESQFQGVMENEYAQMASGCRYAEGSVEADLKKYLPKVFPPDFEYKPTFTLIVVQKRHHTRFWAASHINNSQYFADSNNENVPPGTVVDRFITGFLRVNPVISGKGRNQCYAENELSYPKEFFLCSHKGLLGTSRPTHYYVIHDELGMTADQIQEFSYYLCYLFQRAPSPVSIPAPVYYAHLACYRARKHYMVKREDQTTAISEKIRVRDSLADSMYFQ